MDTFAVIQHSSGPQGGFVVRTIPGGDFLPAPYRLSDAVAVYNYRSDAEKRADKLNK